jgi:hypothetical protein
MRPRHKPKPNRLEWLGREVNAAIEAWERWAEDTSQPYPEVHVHNYAINLGLVAHRSRGG